MRCSPILLPLLLLALLVTPVMGDEPAPDIEKPSDAWTTFNKDVRELPRAEQRFGRARLAKAYLDAWELSGKAATGDDWLYLGQFEVAANRASAAFTCFRAAIGQDGITPADRARAGQAIAGLLANATHCDELNGTDCTDDAVQLVMAWLDAEPVEGTESLCAAAHMSLAGFYARSDDLENSIEHYLASATLSPGNAYRSGRSISRQLMGSTYSMDAYPKLLERATTVRATLYALAKQPVAVAEEQLAKVTADAAATDKERELAVKRLDSAKKSVERIEGMLVPFQMLGNDAPAWTLDHAFGDTKALADLKGKVVLIDFWATWCGWCIKSLPALRDLVRDYGDQGFTIIGVTASANTVYDARYDLDDDMTAKKTEGWRPASAARFARGAEEPNAEAGIFAKDDTAGFQAAEREAIARFIGNHEMTWPVVMIDKAEPSAKFALQGWPHAVVIDRQGRVRYFKVGALLREREEQVKHFREVLEALLAEPTPDPN